MKVRACGGAAVGKAWDAYKATVHEMRTEIVRLKMQLERYRTGAVKRQLQGALSASAARRVELGERLEDTLREVAKLRAQIQRIKHLGESSERMEGLKKQLAEEKRLRFEADHKLRIQAVELNNAEKGLGGSREALRILGVELEKSEVANKQLHEAHSALALQRDEAESYLENERREVKYWMGKADAKEVVGLRVAIEHVEGERDAERRENTRLASELATRTRLYEDKSTHVATLAAENTRQAVALRLVVLYCAVGRYGAAWATARAVEDGRGCFHHGKGMPPCAWCVAGVLDQPEPPSDKPAIRQLCEGRPMALKPVPRGECCCCRDGVCNGAHGESCPPVEVPRG